MPAGDAGAAELTPSSVFALLALASAAVYGAADFIGGLVARRVPTLVVVFVSQGAGLALLAGLLPLAGDAAPGARDWIWGGVAGLAGGTGVALLYRALAVGVMAVVAPVTAVCGVMLPVVAALVMGERPGVRAGGGIALALLAIVLVSQQAARGDADGAAAHRSGLGLAFASGIAIGLFYLALARTSGTAGLWPLLAARVASALLFGAALFVARPPLRMPPGVLAVAVAGGVLDMLANLLYLLATRQGPLTLVVTLTSLYPASTVVLARSLLHERLAALQWVGVACALVAIVLIVSA